MYWDDEFNIVRYDVQGFIDKTFTLKGLMTCHLQPYKEEIMEDKGTLVQIDLTREQSVSDEIEVILGDYEIVLRNGKTYFVKKKPQKPKTYEECCKVLNISYPYFKTEEDGVSASTYKNELFGALKQLLICRDAYWKIAGEQMGLGKPWEPEFRFGKKKYGIMTKDNKVIKATVEETNRFLVFPTEEMRDAFSESKDFQALMDLCKEFL